MTAMSILTKSLEHLLDGFVLAAGGKLEGALYDVLIVRFRQGFMWRLRMISLARSLSESRGAQSRLEETHVTSSKLIEMTVEIVSAHVCANKIKLDDLPPMIRSVYDSLDGLGRPAPTAGERDSKPTAAQIRKSIRPDGLVSFIDGKSYKMLKRHLAAHGLSLADYRAKYGLPDDYPSTAADYSALRSHHAKASHLGEKGRSSKDGAKAEG